MKVIFLPGGIGYIGSHTMVEILKDTPYEVVVLDDYSNCQADVVDRIQKTAEIQKVSNFRDRVTIHSGNVLDIEAVKKIFEEQLQKGKPITTIIHFAAKKSSIESTQFPLMYFENNFVGSLNLLKVMETYTHCKEIMFSSTAAVYGDQNHCTQKFKTEPMSAYGESKLCVEFMLKSVARVHPEWKVISLRYFNPGGCHEAGLIGDWPCGYPSNLFPVLQEVIQGKRKHINVFGNDYPTSDGTGVRDFIHVVDLAKGHLKALEKFAKLETNYEVYNLGCGRGYTVLEVINAFEKALGAKIPYEFVGRREGDMAELVAVVHKANKELEWSARRTIQEMCDSCVKFTLTSQKAVQENGTKID